METISNVGKVIADLGDVYVENAATPVIAGTINYDTGSADISYVKLTTGQNWATSIRETLPSPSSSVLLTLLPTLCSALP